MKTNTPNYSILYVEKARVVTLMIWNSEEKLYYLIQQLQLQNRGSQWRVYAFQGYECII